MRLNRVLILNVNKNTVEFDLNNFLKMRDINSSDISHIGRIVRKCILEKEFYPIFKQIKIPFTKWYLIKDKNGNNTLAKLKYTDYTIGCLTIAPIILIPIIIIIPIRIITIGILGYLCFNYL